MTCEVLQQHAYETDTAGMNYDIERCWRDIAPCPLSSPVRCRRSPGVRHPNPRKCFDKFQTKRYENELRARVPHLVFAKREPTEKVPRGNRTDDTRIPSTNLTRPLCIRGVIVILRVKSKLGPRETNRSQSRQIDESPRNTILLEPLAQARTPLERAKVPPWTSLCPTDLAPYPRRRVMSNSSSGRLERCGNFRDGLGSLCLRPAGWGCQKRYRDIHEDVEMGGGGRDSNRRRERDVWGTIHDTVHD